MNTPAMAQIAEGVARAEVTSTFPKYRQIIDALVRAIEHGALTPGDRLPPEIKLARALLRQPRDRSEGAGASRRQRLLAADAAAAARSSRAGRRRTCSSSGSGTRRPATS